MKIVIVGAGASGMVCAIVAKRRGLSVLIIEQLDKIGAKLKATGGGRCNLTNTLSNLEFMDSFGKNGRFMQYALEVFDYKALMEFFESIGVSTHIPDGFRVFPTTHNSSTIIDALNSQMDKLGIDVVLNSRVDEIVGDESGVSGVKTQNRLYKAKNIVIATGGLGYSKLGSLGDGYSFAKELGHSITPLHPAMLPLITKEKWVANCKADTIAKAIISVDMKKHKKLKMSGDLIFTDYGIRGPVVLDFARELTPLIDKYKELPILINMTKMSEDEIISHLKSNHSKNPTATIVELIKDILPISVTTQLCKLANIEPTTTYKNLKGESKNHLIKLLSNTPLTLIDHIGFDKAMVTRGGVSLKQIDSKTMQSKIVDGLYFCGEVVDIDGPCGGYNLHWAFASGNLVGSSIIKSI